MRTGWRARRRDYGLEWQFEREVRQVPPSARAGLLAWLRDWRRRPCRVFWVVDGVGQWRRV